MPEMFLVGLKNVPPEREELGFADATRNVIIREVGKEVILRPEALES